MNKEQYISKLATHLRGMPKEDRDEAIAFYSEYLDDAGVENEEATIASLGTPRELARKIFIECVDKNYVEQVNSEDDRESDINEIATSDNRETETKTKKNNMSTVWVVLLAIFALPFSPIPIALSIVAFAVLLSILITIYSCALSGAATVIAGIGTLILGFIVLFTDPINCILLFGLGILCIGIGLLLMVGFLELGNLLIGLFIKCGSKVVHEKKGGKQHAKVDETVS
ncbi:MAG TPA: DUF1700 domain-containing protein [Bacillota bacterium]|mgnify:CR=1 FL=1|nr:DUF1700 domain-containing protein [Bacillota bacterium]